MQKRIPLEGRFFARSHELNRIRACLDSKGVKIVLVSGSSGVGKSRLLHAAVASNGNTETPFLLGFSKFDSQTAPLEAIQDCVIDILQKIQTDKNLLQLVCERLRQCMEKDHQELLQSAIPETRSLLALKVEHEERKEENWRMSNAMIGRESALQLQLALKSFFRAVSEFRKIVLLLDDLHRCCQDSFDIISSIFSDAEVSNMVLCASYRDDEMTGELSAFVSTMHDVLSLDAIHSECLTCFDVESVNHILVSLLHVDSNEETRELAELVHQRTDGNIFFVRQFLEELQREGLLQYSFMTDKWEYDLQRIQDGTALCENILQMVAQRIHRLEPPLQSLLKLFSCFGSRSNESIMEICKATFPEITLLHELLEVACHREHLLDDLGKGWYKFSHDKVFETAQSMLPTGDEREQLHWSIGKLLLRALDGSTLDADRSIFICADHLNVGALHFIKNEEEKAEIAKLNLFAAKSAARLSSFRPACKYCQAAIGILGSDIVDASEVSLDLCVHYANMLFCCGEMAQATDYCNIVFASESVGHKIQCYLIMLQILMSGAKNQNVVDFAITALKELGEVIPRKPNRLQAQRCYWKTTKLLNDSTPEDILKLPLMRDFRKAACIEIMLVMVMPLVHLGKHNLHTVVVERMLSLTFHHGLTMATPEAFAVAGVDVISQRDDLKNGYQLGKLAVSLADRLKASRVLAKVHMWTSVFTQWWMEPLSQCLESALKGYKAGMAIGDQHFGLHCITAYTVAYVYSGIPLLSLLDDLDKFCKQMIDYGQVMVLFCVIPMWQFALNLCGKSDSPLDMSRGYAIDKQTSAGNEDRIGEQACWSFLMQLCFYFDDMDKAFDLSQRLQQLKIGITRAEVFYPTRVFFFSLIAFDQFRRTGRRKFKQEAKKHMNQIFKWIKLGAINLVHKGMILQAEMDSLLSSKDPEAVRSQYDKALAFAIRSGFLQDGALACQLAASFCEKNLPGFYMQEYVLKAREHWMAWDAIAVAQHLEKKYVDVFRSESNPSITQSDNASSQERGGSGFRGRRRFSTTVGKMHDHLDYQK